MPIDKVITCVFVILRGIVYDRIQTVGFIGMVANRWFAASKFYNGIEIF